MNARKTTFLFLLLAFAQLSFGQSPYRLDWKKETAFIGGGAAVLGLGQYFSTQTPLFTPDELMTLDPNDINAFDRLATDYSSVGAHRLSNYFWWGSHALPLAFLAGDETRRDAGKIGLMCFETALVTAGITQIFKSTFRRPRPFVFDPNADIALKQKVNAKASFLSGHTSMTAANTFFVAKVYSDYYPDSKWKPFVWGAAAAIPAVTGYLRVRAGRHYPTDVIAGYALGATVGYLIPQLHHNKDRKLKNLSLVPGLSSIYCSWEF